MRKEIKVPELPKGFVYLTKTHKVTGTGESYKANKQRPSS
jgi:hypothetical protein